MVALSRRSDRSVRNYYIAVITNISSCHCVGKGICDRFCLPFCLYLSVFPKVIKYRLDTCVNQRACMPSLKKTVEVKCRDHIHLLDVQLFFEMVALLCTVVSLLF